MRSDSAAGSVGLFEELKNLGKDGNFGRGLEGVNVLMTLGFRVCSL